MDFVGLVQGQVAVRLVITELTHRIGAEPMFVRVRPCTASAKMGTFAQQPQSDEPLLEFCAYCTIVVAQIVIKQHLKTDVGPLCSVHWR